MAGQSNVATGHWRQYVTSDTLQAVDLQGKHHVVVIDRAVPAQMTDRKDSSKSKGVLNVYFVGKRKPLVVKAMLSSVISKLAGSSACKDWVGLAIEIYPTKEWAFGENHDVVRIIPKRPTPEQAKAAGAVAPEPDPPATDMKPDEIREGRGGELTDEEKREILERESRENRRG